jgi:hypothetical protein
VSPVVQTGSWPGGNGSDVESVDEGRKSEQERSSGNGNGNGDSNSHNHTYWKTTASVSALS